MIAYIIKSIDGKSFGKGFESNVAAGFGNDDFGFGEGLIERFWGVVVDKDFLFVSFDLSTVGDKVVFQFGGANKKSEANLLCFGRMGKFFEEAVHLTPTRASSAGDD